MSRGSVRTMALGEYSGTPIRRQRVQNLLLTENRFPPNLKIAEHSHTYPHFTIMLDGGFVEQYADQAFVCDKGSILIVPQGQAHADLIGSSGAHSLSIEISRSLERFLSSESDILAQPQVLRDAALDHLVHDLRSRFKANSVSSAFELHCAAMQVILGIFRSAQKASANADQPSWLGEALRLLNEGTKLSVGDLARTVGVSSEHLSRTFKRYHGETIGEYQRKARLKAAAERLRTTTESIAMIAADTGFCDQAHFCTAFRRAYGMTPSTYRLKIS